MRGRFALGIGGFYFILAACSTFAADDDAPTPKPDPTDAAADAADERDDAVGEASTEASTTDAQADAGPCGLDAGVIFVDPFPADTLPPLGWIVGFPGGNDQDSGRAAFISPAAPASPPFALRLTRTGMFGIAITRNVSLGTSTSFELRFKARISRPTQVVFAQIENTDFIVRLLSDGTNVHLQSGKPGGNLTTVSSLPLPQAWDAWSINLDMTSLVALVKTSSNVASGAFPGPAADFLTLSLLAFVDGTNVGTPSVELDDVAGCLPP